MRRFSSNVPFEKARLDLQSPRCRQLSRRACLSVREGMGIECSAAAVTARELLLGWKDYVRVPEHPWTSPACEAWRVSCFDS